MATKQVYPIPKKIKVGYQNYEIRGITKKTASKKKIAGEVDFDKKVIVYDASQTLKELINTFWHEFFHIIGRTYGLDDLNSGLEERIVKAMSDGVTIATLENKEILHWLTQATDEVREKDD